ncbi:prefoldin subunit [Candidatus Woesearchaeota archaeon]|nr:hypothetical protein [uncultured archaeon]AQS32255.1 hypothetical protein [uncultured archaeon]MBS3149373.1 prefoldin subunit [Candidatus Woesearchaeota archaeon]
MVDKSTQKKVEELHNIEENLRVILVQKQNLQIQLLEMENAISELEKTNDNAYKIVGAIMVELPSEEIKKDLNSKKEIVEIKIKNLDKQENKLKEESNSIQKEVLSALKE